MGRVLRQEVVAIRCELATRRRGVPSCECVAAVEPVPASAGWEEHVTEIARLVSQGWGFVLTSRLRAYCPAHVSRVWDCTCITHPEQRFLCTSHGETRELVWVQGITPPQAALELERIGQAA